MLSAFSYDGPILCQICKIPFDIARIRKIEEPVEAAWGSYGQDFVYWDDLHECQHCSAEPRFNPEHAFEHIAGAHCQCRRGYSGDRITVMEMKDINRIQCLKMKRRWKSKLGDEEFEKDAQLCFLTGIGTGGPTDISVEGLEPVKHGVVETLISNFGVNPDYPSDEPWAVPLHPWCFEIFKKQSLKKLGRVDIDKIWKWRDHLGRHQFTGSAERDTDLAIVLGDWYRCEPGTEYLVANPILVPGLEDLLFSCTILHDREDDMVFPVRDGNQSDDLFGKLPTELRSMIFELLSKKDIAHLRLVWRSCSQLSQSYFYHLVLDEMPWIWEVDSLSPRRMDWHKLWCMLVRADGGLCIDSKERMYQLYSESEGSKELLLEEIYRIKAWYKAVHSSPPGEDEILKGLRNRRRIYPVVKEILSVDDPF